MSNSSTVVSPEAKVAELGIEFPAIVDPGGTYVHAVQTGSLLFTAGHPPFRADGSVILGKLGDDLDENQGYEAARCAAISMLATIRHELGSLDRVARIVKVNGVVNATPEFYLHTHVINGASDLLVEVFGERGQHARLAVGYPSLPFNIALEVEAIIEVEA